jgi:hypothetical protein
MSKIPSPAFPLRTVVPVRDYNLLDQVPH